MAFILPTTCFDFDISKDPIDGMSVLVNLFAFRRISDKPIRVPRLAKFSCINTSQNFNEVSTEYCHFRNKSLFYLFVKVMFIIRRWTRFPYVQVYRTVSRNRNLTLTLQRHHMGIMVPQTTGNSTVCLIYYGVGWSNISVDTKMDNKVPRGRGYHTKCIALAEFIHI